MAKLSSLRGRHAELDRLRDSLRLARSGQPQFAIVSGPRRVGKTFLLQHLLTQAEDCATVYFEATEAGERDQLRRFTQSVAAALGPDAPLPGSPFPDWESALQMCEFASRARPLVVVIDEATYLMDSTPGFASMVQVVWDRLSARADGSRLLLVLSGSAVGLIMDMLDYRGALYQRPTIWLTMEPFLPAEAFQFSGQPDPVALFEAYSACGGYPLHLDSWDFEESSEQNLVRLAGTPGGMLLEDAAVVLSSLPEPHRRVLMAAGQGRTRRSEIANEAGGRVDRPLDALVRSRLIRAVSPLGSPVKARPEFRVSDAYLRFWIRILANNIQRVEAGQGVAVLRDRAGEWQYQLGSVFEQAARQHAVRLVHDGTLPPGTLVDEWWTTSGEQVQVDVLGLLEHRTVAIGEAKWQKQPLGVSDTDGLWRALRHVPDPVPQPTFVLWGRGGVRPDATVGQVLGYGPAEMLAM